MDVPDLDQEFKKLGYIPVDFGKHWKLHLNFAHKRPEDQEAVFGQILEMVKPLGCQAKIGHNSGQPGKDATIYVGSRGRAVLIAREIHKRWGDHLAAPEGDVLNDDRQLYGSVWGRFEVSDGVDYQGRHVNFLQYGKGGISYINDDNAWAIVIGKDPKLKENAIRQSKRILAEALGTYFTGTTEISQAVTLEQPILSNATWVQQMRQAQQRGIKF